jgi:hypothetical protein
MKLLAITATTAACPEADFGRSTIGARVPAAWPASPSSPTEPVDPVDA